MAKRSPAEQYDQIVARLLGRPDTPLERSGATRPFGARLAPVLEIAGALKNLPRVGFKARLKADLERRASMATQAAKPANYMREGFHSLTPYLIVPGAAQWIDFVKRAFGAEEHLRVKRPGAEHLIMHAELQIGDSVVELADATAEFAPMSSTLLLRVPDVDAVYNRAVQAGAKPFGPVRDNPYGTRGGTVTDDSGNRWHIFTPVPGDQIFKDFRSVTPHLYASEPVRLIEFLQRAFGGSEIYRAQMPDGSIPHAQVRIGDSIVALAGGRGPYQAMPSSLHLFVPDTDAAYEQALRAGATSIGAPADHPYGERGAGVIDPFGNRWFIATYLRNAPSPERTP